MIGKHRAGDRPETANGRAQARYGRSAPVIAAAAAALFLLPNASALALGIGEQSGLSHLFEPLRVEIPIELGGIAPEDVRIALQLGDLAAAGRGLGAGSDVGLTREIVVDGRGRALLRISSSRVVRDPALVLNIDLSASGLRIRRELALLFDPSTAVANVDLPAPAEFLAGDTAAAAERVLDQVTGAPASMAPKPLVRPVRAQVRAAHRKHIRQVHRLPSAPAVAPVAAAATQAVIAIARFQLAERLSLDPSRFALVPVDNRATLRPSEQLAPSSQAMLEIAAERDAAARRATAALVAANHEEPAAPVPASAPTRISEAPVASAAALPLLAQAMPDNAAAAPAADPIAGNRSSARPAPLVLLGILLGGAALAFGALLRALRRAAPLAPLPPSGASRHSLLAGDLPPRLAETAIVERPPALVRSRPEVVAEAQVVEAVEPHREPSLVKPHADWSPEEFDLLEPIDDEPVRRL